MATTDWDYSSAFQTKYPHTFNALQALVLTMSKFVKNYGKKTFFGRDKGLDAYKNFESALRDTLLAMVLDGAIQRNAEARECRKVLTEMLLHFERTFPNWQDAYSFAQEYFIDEATVAEDRIRQLMRQ